MRGDKKMRTEIIFDPNEVSAIRSNVRDMEQVVEKLVKQYEMNPDNFLVESINHLRHKIQELKDILDV
jgi:hypothetical protein